MDLSIGVFKNKGIFMKIKSDEAMSINRNYKFIGTE